VRLEGSLDAFSLPDIFSLLSMTKKTGGLHLRRSGAHGVVWLTDGLISGGASDLSRLSLGRRLAGSTHVTDEDLSAAVEQVAGSAGIGVARALRDAGAIEEGELHTLVCEHVIDTVFDLMRWTEGVFEFVLDEANFDDVGVVREVDEVVTEARQRLESWTALDDRLASPDTVLSLALSPDTDPQLLRDEWALLALVDGRRTVGDLVALGGRGEYAVVVALAELVAKGLVLTEESEGVAALVRRQELVATLETEAASVTAILSDVLNEPADGTVDADPMELAAEPVMPEGDTSLDVAPIEPLHAVASSADDAAESDEGGQVAAIASLPHSATLSDDIAAATSKRSGLLAESDGPDLPEPLAAAVAGGGMVAAAMPAGAIERDPSVNKSLLLRLIAGVRGL
jgi:Domain of unknown function (DUF4388)